jgi:hypothetical protein
MAAAQVGHCDDLYFLIEEAGSNNCYELNNRRRSRSWECLAAGGRSDCLAEVTRCAASCCGGSLVLYGRRRHTQPETYIRAWRRAIASAVPFQDARRMGFSLQLFTRLTAAEAADGRKYAFDLLSKQTLVPVGQYTDPYHGTTAMEWRFNASVPEQINLWLETKANGRGWHSVEADGPDR